MAGLVIKNLCKNFDINGEKIEVLKNINLVVEDKSFVTIIGKSGCGKTTLLRILCGLEEKTLGSFEFTNCNQNEDKKIGIVFQEPRLMPWLTVKENMAISLMNCNDKEYVDEIVNSNLELLGLYKFRNAYPSQISGGMAQRVSLGRTLCYNPQIILMDEPLGALDAFTRRNLQKELIDIFVKKNKTIIFVTHDVEEAIYLGQKVVIMNLGSNVKEIPVKLKYYRNTEDIEFFNLRKKILKICSEL